MATIPASKPNRGGRPRRAAVADIETRIVAAARALFFAHGYGATSIEAIAKHAAVSKRTFYDRFKNKAAILAAVVNGLVARVSPHDVGGLFEGTSTGEILERVGHALLAAALQPDTLALHRIIVAEATRFPELALVMTTQGARQDAIARIAALLQKEKSVGGLSGNDSALAAEMFMQLIIGVPQRRALGLGQPMSERELDQWVKQATVLFFKGWAEMSEIALTKCHPERSAAKPKDLF